MRSMKRALMGGALAFVALIGMAGAASACTWQCAEVGPNYCMRCVDAGYFTGETCQNFGQCGCFDVRNNCGLFALSGIKPAEQQASFMVSAGQSPVCSADSPADAPAVH